MFSESMGLSDEMQAWLCAKLESYIVQSIEAADALIAAKEIKTDALIVHDCHDKLIPVEVGYATGEAVERRYHRHREFRTLRCIG